VTEQPIRIMIADDNEDHVFLAVRALEDLNGTHLEVQAVRDGAEALAYINGEGRFAGRTLPHLILLDIKMPKVDGLEVLRILKEDPIFRVIPVVMLSASERPEDVDESYKLGANSYVTKPAGVGEFREGIAKLKHYWTELSSLPMANG
jgi:two-component system response regulator